MRVGTAAIKDYGLRASVKLRRYTAQARENPRWLLVFALARFNTVRAVARRLGPRPRFGNTDQLAESLFRDLDNDLVVCSLNADGLHPGVNLPGDLVNEIYEFACSAEGCANGDPAVPIRVCDRMKNDASPPATLITCTFPDLVDRLPVIRRLQDDPKLVEIASRYLHTRPVASSRLWWSFPTESSREQQLAHAQGTFHYDPDVDFHALKFFFYINDVDDTCGPHVCVRGSHKRKRLAHKLTLFIGQSDEAIDTYYGPNNVLTITGPRGFGIAEDPMCFHKGQPPRDKPRLMLELSYRLPKSFPFG